MTFPPINSNKLVKINIVTHYLEDDKKFVGPYRFVTVEVNGIVRRFEEYYYGRGEDRADAYVDAICEHSGWKIKTEWINRNDAKVPVKSKPKQSKPFPHERKKRPEDNTSE